ncbi:MAG: hypothetical protein M1815_002040 [Lichina confinis]|nr:MAG: hypothetical protein M1815_002040 [Lichina confinis]
MAAMEDADLFRWYLGLHARALDLVSDYAGNELFIIEGDSLLLHCFGDDRIDLEDGFQLLHAAYTVELFLQALVQRHCNFHVVFIDDNALLCVPPKHVELQNRYLLARSVIIRHLKHHLPRNHDGLEIHTFASVQDPDFGDYLSSASVYFIMCHDGAEASRMGKDSLPPTNAAHVESQKRSFRSLIRHFILQGYDVALVNGLDVRDSKVIAMVVEGRLEDFRGSTRKLGGNVRPSSAGISGDLPLAKMSLDEKSDGVNGHAQSPRVPNSRYEPLRSLAKRLEGTNLCRQRLVFTIWTVAELVSKDSDPDPDQQTLASAFLLHAVLLSHLQLAARHVNEARFADHPSSQAYRSFLDEFASLARSAIDHAGSDQLFEKSKAPCDVVDLIDGRLFKMVISALQGRTDTSHLLPKDIVADFSLAASMVEARTGTRLSLGSEHHLETQIIPAPSFKRRRAEVLRFSNPIFDRHLQSVNIDVAVQDRKDPENAKGRIFKEISHWQNPNRPMDRVKALSTMDDLQRKRVLRSNQRRMDEMMKYAASLTNAAGKTLSPQTVIVQKEGKPQPPATSGSTTTTKPDAASGQAKGKSGGKKPVAGHKQSLQKLMDTKKDADLKKIFASWGLVRQGLDKVQDPETRYQRTRSYLQGLADEKADVLNAEVMLYSIQPLLSIWAGYCRKGQKEDGYSIAALIWSTLHRLCDLQDGLTKAIAKHAQEVHRLLGLRANDSLSSVTVERALTFTFSAPATLSYNLSVEMSTQDFQLHHCGPYLDRNMDSQPDPRVSFNPDRWQRQVLDELDANHSVFVVAPTSAGKTFISFYAMEKVLRQDDDAVLVYVAPTKALVNQIAAEVQARFSKKYRHPGKGVWAIHTRDYRVNNPAGCQILVTVPHILQTMLLSASNARTWAPRVKCIIFDEIHSIGQSEDGVVWEQLLLLAPCPIIALSATVGNPEEFNDWLAATQRSSGLHLTMIQHHHRYSDLRKFIYEPPERFGFTGLQKRWKLGQVGLDGIPGFQFFHPVASLQNESRGIPADLSLEARDCLTLWQTMAKHQTPDFPVPKSLDPNTGLPGQIKKIDVIKWERELKKLLLAWMASPHSPFRKVYDDLSMPLEAPRSEMVQVSPASLSPELAEPIDRESLADTVLPLLTDLYERNALPAILFNFDRSQCEALAHAVLRRLEQAETSWKETSSKWQTLVDGYEKWKASKASKPARAIKAKGKKDDGAERLSKADQERDSADQESNRFESFDPAAPREDFSFADVSKAEKVEIEDYFRGLTREGVDDWLMAALTRGIGAHHSGMNRRYRQTVEILFRKGYLRVVIATETLALGINMPCKTVVFSGDSVFLTALNFRQCAGRAGRRGFDILGNVVFHGPSFDKASRLLSSRLPNLSGQFPMTTTLVLRLFTLLHDSKDSEYAKRIVSSLLSQPRLYLGGEIFKEQVLHHVRFSIEYLRRQRLLGAHGEPLNFTSCVSHLYYTENSSFAFHALLKAGFFHALCADVNEKPAVVLRQLMLVMAHLFGRRPLRTAEIEFIEETVKTSQSIVFLPELPRKARKILREHNEETLDIFTTYVKTFAEQSITSDDRSLPLTGLDVGSDQPLSVAALKQLPPTTARSPFVALSGHSDNFTSISDLCSSTRAGIFLEKSIVPHVDVPSDTPLNAYLYDFFMHGSVEPLAKANGIRKADVWFVLKDFSMVLATVVTSLTNFLKGGSLDDEDIMNVLDDEAIAEEEAQADTPKEKLDVASKSETNKVPEMKSVSRKKKDVPDSWDAAVGDGDDDDDDEPDDVDQEAQSSSGTDSSSDDDDGDDVDDDDSSSGMDAEKGLSNVLAAMKLLQADFDLKFRAMWA